MSSSSEQMPTFVAINGPVTPEVLNERIRLVIDNASANSLPGADGLTTCVVIFDHLLTDFEKDCVRGSLLSFPIVNDGWPGPSYHEIIFADTASSGDPTLNGTKVHFKIDAAVETEQAA